MTVCYGYIRISPKIKDIDNRIDALKNYNENIQLIMETKIRGNIPLLERPRFSELNTKLQQGDELTVWWIDELGKEFATCVSNIKHLINRGITIKTLVQSLEFRLDDSITDSLIKMLQGYADSEHHRRIFAAEMGRRALREDHENWKAKFRGRKRDEGKHREIAQALFEGKTLQNVAEETGASLSTVKRVKAKIKDQDELGHLRERGHGRKHGDKPHRKGLARNKHHHNKEHL